MVAAPPLVQQAKATSKSCAPPIEGWDTESSLSDMPKERAIKLDNWFSDNEAVKVRGGSQEYASGMPGEVDTVIEYVSDSGAPQLFAASGGGIYDVSSGGSVGAPVVAGQNSNRWQQVQLNPGSGNYAFVCNGINPALLYDGTTWGASGITGPDMSKVVWCNIHQKRLWIGEENSMEAWYLDTDAVTGAATKFNLGSQASMGGYITEMATWTRDSGEGQDDVAVFLTSEGEAIVYQGTDPATAANWNLIGKFRIGHPLGRRSAIKFGGDLMIATESGILPMSTALLTDRSQADRIALSRQIQKAVTNAHRSAKGFFGWQPFLYADNNQAIINYPRSDGSFAQFVFNTITGAPGHFVGMNSRCWGLKGDEPFFGTDDGRIVQYDIGANDDGVNIEADVIQAFWDMGYSQRIKRFSNVELVVQSPDDPQIAMQLLLDYKIQPVSTLPPQQPSDFAVWDESLWDESVWAGDDTIFSSFRGAAGLGRVAALRLRCSVNNIRPAWIESRFVFTPGGIIG